MRKCELLFPGAVDLQPHGRESWRSAEVVRELPFGLGGHEQQVGLESQNRWFIEYQTLSLVFVISTTCEGIKKKRTSLCYSLFF